ncbi:MAG: metallophosphoesterase, partial [Bacteroidota bacterium]|nr:metallophosphoesterase [Bacteroidota bacterium]
MRTPLRCFLFSFLVCGLAYAQIDTITILHVNDTHSNLLPSGPRDAGTLAQNAGGIARLSTYLEESRADDPDLLFLHAGDASVGDLMYNALLGMLELELLETMGLNAMALGNHEFDLGAPILEAVLDSANVSFPLLSANFTLLDSTLASLDLRVMPETIFDVKGHKIGVFGLTTPTTNILSNAYPYVAFADTLIPDLASASVQSLRAQGCEAVILLSHLGLNGDILIAEQIPGVDLIIGGHDHRAMDAPLYID